VRAEVTATIPFNTVNDDVWFAIFFSHVYEMFVFHGNFTWLLTFG